MMDFTNPLSSLPLPGLSQQESTDYQTWLQQNQSAIGQLDAANPTMDQIFSDSPQEKVALSTLAPTLSQQLKNGTATPNSMSMLATLLASTQDQLDSALYEGTDPDWEAEEDPTQRASESLDGLYNQYGWVNGLQPTQQPQS